MIDSIHLVGILHTMQFPSPASRRRHIPRWWDEAAVGLSQEAGNGDDEVCGECFCTQTKTQVKQKKDKFQKQKL